MKLIAGNIDSKPEQWETSTHAILFNLNIFIYKIFILISIHLSEVVTGIISIIREQNNPGS